MKLRYLLSTLLFLNLSVFSSLAQTADVEDYGKLNVVSVDDYFDLYNDLHSNNAQEAYERYVGEFIEIDLEGSEFDDKSSDGVYEQRLKMMATEIQLPYNDVVRRYINTYTKQGGTMERVLGIAKYYFPIFEQILYENDLPLELKMVPVIESALIPVAKSRAAAVGLWQMMMATAKYYGLEINSFVDERQDPVKSTRAACLFLKDLYKTYNDWTLVIAAYNCGAGNVNKAIKRAGTANSYWDIWSHLPRETRSYVPAYIGATYGYTFYKAHNLNPVEVTQTLAVDTVMINKMMHFKQVTTTLDISEESLRALNPQYRIDIVPAIEKQYELVLPMNLIDDFIENEAEIYAKDTAYLKNYLKIENLTSAKAESVAPGGGQQVRYKIKSGDTLGGIAARYKVKVSDIQKWNNMSGTNIRVGRYLTIYTK